MLMSKEPLAPSQDLPCRTLIVSQLRASRCISRAGGLAGPSDRSGQGWLQVGRTLPGSLCVQNPRGYRVTHLRVTRGQEPSQIPGDDRPGH